MAFKQTRLPRHDPRARRNAGRFQDSDFLLAPSGGLSLDSDGRIQIDLGAGLEIDAGDLAIDAGDGIEFAAGAVAVDLADTNPGLTFVSGELAALVQDVLSIDASGIKLNYGDGLTAATSTLVVNLAANSGLEFATGALQLDLAAAGGLTLTTNELLILLDGNSLSLSASGIKVETANLSAATTLAKGVVNQAIAVADLTQTISDPPTQTEVQDLSDKVDELLGSLRTAGLLAT